MPHELSVVPSESLLTDQANFRMCAHGEGWPVRCKCLLSSVILHAAGCAETIGAAGRRFPVPEGLAMNNGYRVIAAMGCLLASLCVNAQVGNRVRKIVLPNPGLIHCRSAECSQLWKQDSGDGGVVYPAQVFTDFANGEVVGLTAVYDKSISLAEIRSVIDTLYPKAAMRGLPGMWRVEAEQLVIQLSDRKDGIKQLIYLKIGKNLDDFVPSAHICSE